jgi:hypothetical protein
MDFENLLGWIVSIAIVAAFVVMIGLAMCWIPPEVIGITDHSCD